MKRRGLYTPAWRSPTDTDRKLGVVTSNELTGNESRTLLPRHDGKVVPVCVRIEDNGLCSDDAEEDETERLAATTDNHVDENLRLDCDWVERDDVHRPTSPLSSSSSMSADDLQGYDDSNLQTSVYDLPPELVGSRSSTVPPRRRSHSESAAELRPSRRERLVNDALSAVVRSCRKSKDSARDDDIDDVDRLSAVSAPAIFVVSDAKQLVIFTVDRSTSFSSPVVRVPPLSHSDPALNR